MPRTAPAAVVALLALLAALVGWTALRATASTGTVYEAESAALSGGAVVASDHTGYTGSGFVGGYTDADKGTAATTFSVSAATAGGYVSALRYANGTTATQTLSVYVNGAKTVQIALPATTDWNTWSTVTTPVTLKAGSDTVAYRFDSADSGNVNLDDITLAAAPVPPSGQYEAESAALSGGAVIVSDHTGYTGSGFVGGYTDAGKGTAATTFSVTAATAGSTPVTLRYANGTGSTRTLSVYVNGTKAVATSLPATANWDTWGTTTENLNLNAGANTVAYRFDSTDNGNVNLDNITVGTTTTTPPTTPPTSPPPGGQVYDAATAFFTGGPSVGTSISGYNGSGYLTGFTAQGAQTQVDTAVPAAGDYPVSLTYANSTGTAQTLSLYLNGIRNGQLSLPAGSGWLSVSRTVTLRSGLNLIGLQHDSGDSGGVAVDGVSIAGGAALAAQGATVPYTEYRAADGATNGTVLPVSRTYPSLSSEATGRSAVQLTGTGKYVQVTLTKPANAVVVRYSIPDTSTGTPTTAPLALYAGGTKVTDLTLTNTYAWLYGGGYYDTNNPADGSGHHFYDEVRFRNSATWPAGTVLKLQKDSTAGGTFTVDTVDAEQVDAAYAMPAGYVSAAGYGVTPGGADVTSALNSALSQLSSTGQGLWLPAGTYTISGRVSLNNVSLRGAGQWYTTIRSTAENGSGGLYTTGGRNQIADLTVSGDQTSRNNDQGAAAIEGSFASGSLILDVWMEHTKVGLWAVPGTGLDAAGLRVRDVFADGVHIHGGSSGSTVEQSSVRNTGDDTIALDTEGGNVTNCTVSHNTSQSPIQANGIGVYGGGDNTIQNNAVSDTVAFGSGITVSTYFGQNFSGPTTVRDNLLTRTGSYHSNWASDIGALWIYAANQGDITQPVKVTGNTIKDSTYQAVLLSYGHTISNLTFDRDTITGAGTYGFDINNVTGSMTVSNTTVSGAASGGLNNPGNYTVTRGSGNSGF
ncbi:CBM35 domain-containing protein [Actinacidiphila paucisporea]|uniref:CBM35 domain-containing protein n=1 Tax=Actinacidiphila paucisporea TaxID=310782 RepID=UPI001F27F309|nr:CBM35 domain-containing protein [Actinacidiphila paucisporea]